MSERELACWRENKKTIVNSLQTLSSQIYSARARILYELIQNADDCSYEDGPVDGEVAAGGSGPAVAASEELRFLHIEASDDVLVAFHNERGFQPKDLYALCQVGESSKPLGSGKIGRKGIGFKSVFQITDRPLLVSPPFSFTFDTVCRGVFGYIVPSWVDRPEASIPARHHSLLRRLLPEGSSAAACQTASPSGTLLVCPLAARACGEDLMRDVHFDGLSLAFLKNLQKITFSSTTTSASAHSADAVAPPTATPSTAAPPALRAPAATTREHRIESTVVFDNDTQQPGDGDVGQPVAGGSGLLKDLRVVRHELRQVRGVHASR